MKNTKIEWCDHTVNWWWGCSKVSEACLNCYAERDAKRWGKDCFGDGNPRWLKLDSANAEIEKLNRAAQKRGVIETVFVNSMSDFFDDRVAVEIRHMCWTHMRRATNFVFLVLTKRAHVMANHFRLWADHIPPNVRFGITAENQTRLDERMAFLRGFSSRKFFISAEPLLEQIDITPYAKNIDWVICGGENAPLTKCREFDSRWASDLMYQAKRFRIPYFFKSAGKNHLCWSTDKEALTTREFYRVAQQVKDKNLLKPHNSEKDSTTSRKWRILPAATSMPLSAQPKNSFGQNNTNSYWKGTNNEISNQER